MTAEELIQLRQGIFEFCPSKIRIRFSIVDKLYQQQDRQKKPASSVKVRAELAEHIFPYKQKCRQEI